MNPALPKKMKIRKNQEEPGAFAEVKTGIIVKKKGRAG